MGSGWPPHLLGEYCLSRTPAPALHGYLAISVKVCFSCTRQAPSDALLLRLLSSIYWGMAATATLLIQVWPLSLQAQCASQQYACQYCVMLWSVLYAFRRKRFRRVKWHYSCARVVSKSSTARYQHGSFDKLPRTRVSYRLDAIGSGATRIWINKQ